MCSSDLFRPSDDSTIFPFLVPSNMFAVVELRHLAELFAAVLKQPEFAAECRTLADEVERAILTYAVVEHERFGKVFAYEVDGFGNRLFMDDANAPNLVSIPYIGFVPASNPIYKNTRAFALSDSNPYFAKGTAAEGVGSPHTGKRSVWHIGIIMRALTSADDAEIAKCLAMGLVYGQYDAKEEGFVPGGGSLHNQMSAHGPDLDAFEKASNADLQPQKLAGTMAFMFESRYIIRPTKFAMETEALQKNYYEVWQGLSKNFPT